MSEMLNLFQQGAFSVVSLKKHAHILLFLKIYF